MCQVIEKAAFDAGISIEGANALFVVFINRVIDKVPELSQLIEEVFAETEEELLRQQVNKAASLIQQHAADSYKAWNLPIEAVRKFGQTGKGELF